jgi:hypothetical protein
MADNITNKQTPALDLNTLPDGFLVLDEQGQTFQLNQGQLRPFVYADKKVKKDMNQSEAMVTSGYDEPMLQPPPLSVQANSASFYFHPEDEEEVLKNSRRAIGLEAPRQFSAQKIANKAEQIFALKLLPAEQQRLSQLILSVMRERRSLTETEVLLTDNHSPLGFGLPAPVAGAMITYIKQIKEKVSKEGGLVVDEAEIKNNNQAESVNNQTVAVSKKDFFVKPKHSVIDEVVQEVRQRISQAPAPEASMAASVKTEGANNNQDVGVIDLHLRNAVNIASQQARHVETERPVNISLSRFVSQARPGISDVRIDNKSIGPVDELALMNAATFRRLAADPNQASGRILAIITALGKQSLARKTAGLMAWRSSPLYKQYLSIGQQSMESGQPIPEVINQLKVSNQEYLTLTEFEAISDLNRLMRM